MTALTNSRLKDVCLRITDGSHNPPKGLEKSDYLMLSSKNIEDGCLNYDNPRFLSKEDFNQENKRSDVKEGDVLLTIVGTIGRCCVVPAHNGNITFQRSVAILKPDYNKVLSRYLMYQLLSLNKYLNSAAQGVAQKGIYLKSLQELQFPIPPLPVQKAIVAKLDAAFASIEQAIAAAERNAENAKQLFQSYLSDVFERGGEGWVNKKFDEICVLQRGFDLPTQLRSEGEYPLVSSNGITDNISDFKVGSPGVVTGRSGTIGRVHYIEKPFWPLNTALYIKNFHGNFPKFIYHFLRYLRLERFSSGAGVPTLNRNVVHRALASVPEDISLQEQISINFDDCLQLTTGLEQIERNKKKLYNELKQSLLQQAFNGQLVDA